MRNVFVETRNVREFMNTANALIRREAGTPGLGLVHGQRGRGKTRTAVWFQANNDATVLVRAKKIWQPGWMLEEIAVELGIVPKKRAKDLFEDVANALKESPHLILVDECNLPCAACLETLRDLHDVTECPILLIGHEGIVRRLKRMAPLWDRLLYVTEFKAIGMEDLENFAASCLDRGVEADALSKALAETGGNFRKCVIALKSAEDRAKVGNKKIITADLVLPRR